MKLSQKTIRLIRNIIAIAIIGLCIFNFVNNFLSSLQPTNPVITDPPVVQQLDENAEYNKMEDVALYIHLYGHLPSNFMTKSEAKKQGWSNGALDTVISGKSIGGDRFGNNEGLLPKKDGRQYYECDIDTVGEKSRGAKRIVFSNDGLVYYTDDHYESFTLLYGEE